MRMSKEIKLGIKKSSRGENKTQPHRGRKTLPKTSLTSRPLNDPDGGVHLVWPRIAALLETIPPQGAVTAEQGPA